MTQRSSAQPLIAGVVTALVGFSSSFAVVIAGLRAVGADAAQASSGLLVLSVTMGLGCIAFAVALRRPITLAWSTPGAALLVTAGPLDGGFQAAVGAFLLTGALLALTGLVPGAAALIRRIPASVAGAMLAGILLELCIQPFHELHRAPWSIGAMLAVWALAQWLAPRWAIPLTLVAAVVAVVVSHGHPHLPDGPWPHLTVTAPHWSWAAVVSVAAPLYVVTMTSQNIPGLTVLRGFGYEVPWRSTLGYTGAATAAGAVLGGHAINLAAISAALAAGPEAGPDRGRRWIAAVTAGVGYVLLGCAAPVVVAVAAAAPTGVVAAFAGIALLTPLAGAVRQALASAGDRPLPAVVTLCVATSGLTLGGVGAAFWALVAGCVLHALPAGRGLTPRRRP